MRFALIALLLALAPGARAQSETVRAVIELDSRLGEISFAEVILAATGKTVMPIDRERDRAMLEKLSTALDAAMVRLNAPEHPIHGAGRINEASAEIERELLQQLNAVPGWKCAIPRTKSGRSQHSGYPDLRLVLENGDVVYLDPKLMAPDSRESTLRSFYYEPKENTGKVNDDARHLLVGLTHNGRTGDALRLAKWEVVDLSGLKVRLKSEFQAANRDVYREKAVVARSP